MYDYIKGTLVSKNLSNKSSVTVECNNIGYLIETNARTISLLGEINEAAKLYVTLVHREDAMILCGFALKEERDIFNILQSVSGVGVKVALILLDELSGCDLISAVIREDERALSAAKGVGPKLAKKIILELKDKLINWQQKTPIVIEEKIGSNVSQDVVSEAQAVLLSFGYSINEIKSAINYAANSTTDNKNSEEILKLSLQFLATHST